LKAKLWGFSLKIKKGTDKAIIRAGKIERTFFMRRRLEGVFVRLNGEAKANV
jgi:hypothetical protein